MTMNLATQTPLASATRLPQELVESTTFLLKRLGFAAKDRTLAAYEETGLHPYHHAVLLVLDEGAPETQGSIADTLSQAYSQGQDLAGKARRMSSVSRASASRRLRSWVR